jgi:hypothetical protein
VTSLTLGLVVETLGQDRWGAVVSWPELGAESAFELGVPLDHLALVPAPGPKWLDVVGALIDSLDLVVLRPTGRISASTARRIATRARERGCVVMVSLLGTQQWPESFDARFAATDARWVGLHRGSGTVGQRQLDIEVDGRRVPVARTIRLLLPAFGGGMASTAAVVPKSNDGDGFAITA